MRKKTIVTKKEIRELLTKYPDFLNWLIDKKVLKVYIDEVWKATNTNPEGLRKFGESFPVFKTDKEFKAYLLNLMNEFLNSNQPHFEFNLVHFLNWKNTSQKWFFWNRLFMLALIERTNGELYLTYTESEEGSVYSSVLTKDSF